jgi:endothelin-converting enzyme/putative endopeptidase
MRIVRALFVAVLLATICGASGTVSGQQGGEPFTPPKGVDASFLDKSIDPCKDFYEFACGGWKASHPIPADRPEWSTFGELEERNTEALHTILEDASRPGAADRPAYLQKAGDFYAACMDEAEIARRGLAPLAEDFRRIDGLTDRSQLPALVADFHKRNVEVFSGLGPFPDPDDASMTIALVAQGGLGLPERDYYTRTDEHSVALRKQYRAHVRRMLRLSGLSSTRATAGAAAVMEIETALAKASLNAVALRDPQILKNKRPVAELQALTPSFEWAEYFKALGAPPFNIVDVVPADFFKGLEHVLTGRPLSQIKAYLRWQLVHSDAPVLPKAFVDENFAFFGKTLQGSREQRPRWKRCVAQVDSALGEALGRAYVEKYFAGDAKQRALDTVKAISSAMRDDIQSVDWMTSATKQKALEKLELVAERIGYPDTWRDYSSVEITRDDALGNSRRAAIFESTRQLNKIGKPVDRHEWDMTPPTVNAGYDPTLNQMTFPAGILQWPFFLASRDDAMNLGGVGFVVGHELTHGFDDQGRQFDAKGNIADWWTPEDAKGYQQRAQCIVDEYSSFPAAGDLKVNGKLTLGENIADNGGIRLAYAALLAQMARQPLGEADGYTPEQRFFLSAADVWCANVRPEFERLIVQTNPHSPPKYRVNGVVSNMPEFQKAFNCPKGSPMVREQICKVW